MNVRERASVDIHTPVTGGAFQTPGVTCWFLTLIEVCEQMRDTLLLPPFRGWGTVLQGGKALGLLLQRGVAQALPDCCGLLSPAVLPKASSLGALTLQCVCVCISSPLALDL